MVMDSGDNPDRPAPTGPRPCPHHGLPGLHPPPPAATGTGSRVHVGAGRYRHQHAGPGRAVAADGRAAITPLPPILAAASRGLCHHTGPPPTTRPSQGSPPIWPRRWPPAASVRSAAIAQVLRRASGEHDVVERSRAPLPGRGLGQQADPDHFRGIAREGEVTQ